MQISTSEFLGLAILAPTLSVDTEGTDAKKTDVRDGSGFSYGVSAACRHPVTNELISAYFPVRHTKDNIDSETFLLLKALLEKHPQIVGHNILKYDSLALTTVGLSLPPVEEANVFDTMLMCHWLFEEHTDKRFPLDWCVKYFLKRDQAKVKDYQWDFWFATYGWHPDFPQEVMATYACPDAEITLELFEWVKPKWEREFGKIA